jgi:ADP-ribose pyrophosphatase YjhB (NUDIX family)
MVTTPVDAQSSDDFDGAKVALFLGDQLIVIRRDKKPDIPYPDMWDFPGGGRDPGESPFQCVARETQEEVGLILPASAVIWQRRARRASDGLIIWYFVARLPACPLRRKTMSYSATKASSGAWPPSTRSCNGPTSQAHCKIALRCGARALRPATPRLPVCHVDAARVRLGLEGQPAGALHPSRK